MQCFKILLCCLLVFTSFVYSTTPSYQEQWDKMAAEVDLKKVKAGTTTDLNTQDIIIALNLMGIKTRDFFSVISKLGPVLTWDLKYLANESYYEEFKQLQSSIVVEKKRWTPNLELIANLENQRNGVMRKQIKVFTDAIEPVRVLLDQFYTIHPCTYDQALVLEMTNPVQPKMQINGADRLLSHDAAENETKLKVYQNEFKAFGTFLKEGYLQGKL